MGNKLENDKKEDSGKEYVHICKLPREVEVISYFIPDNQKVRQWFRRSCLISSNVSHRRLCVKSHRALEQDRAVHLTQNYYIIHPFSAFRYHWEIFMICVYLMELGVIPYVIILKNTYFDYAIWVVMALQLIALSNMIIQFMSGYFEQSTRNIILEPKMTIMHYLKTYFLPDLLGNLPIEVCFYLMNYRLIFSRAIMLKVIFNVFGLMDYTEKFREKRQYPLCTYRLIQFILLYLIGMLWLTALIGIAVFLDQGVTFSMDMWWLFTNNVFVLIFSLGQTEFILHGFELYVHFIAITFGFIMRNIIIAQIILLFKSYYSSKRKYTQLLIELQEFAHFKRLPKNIKKRIFDYYNFVFQHYYYNENEIWNLMSDKLKYEIEKNLYKIWFEADIFKLCPPQVVQSLVLLLKKEIYLANDILYVYGNVSDYIYFLKCGTVALYDSDNREMTHVKEGSFFSDSALILDQEMKNDSTAVAIEACEIYKLNREDFREVIQHFPEEYKTILSILEKRRTYVKQHPKSFIDLEDYYETQENKRNKSMSMKSALSTQGDDLTDEGQEKMSVASDTSEQDGLEDSDSDDDKK